MDKTARKNLCPEGEVIEYDDRTKEWIEKQECQVGISLMKCEMCGLHYKFSLGHICPVDEKIRAAGSYIIKKHIGALKELTKGPEED